MARKDDLYGNVKKGTEAYPYGLNKKFRPDCNPAPKRAYVFRRKMWEAVCQACPPGMDPRHDGIRGPRKAFQVDLYVNDVFIDFWRYYPPMVNVKLSHRSQESYDVCDYSDEEAQKVAALFWAWAADTLKKRDEMLQAARDAGTL